MDYKLYDGDCLEEMNKISDKSINMILCDLPYGQLKSSTLTWDKIIPFDKLWKQYDRIIKDDGVILLFGSGLFTVDLINSNRKNFKYNLIWEKNVPTWMSSARYRPMKYFETISVFYKSLPTYNPIMKERVGEGKSCYNYEHYCGDSNHLKLDKIKKKYDPNFVQPSDILKFNVVPNRNGKLHPTEKPIELLKYLIKTYSNENDTVLDNCFGSCSCGVACKETNRNFIGIEKDENYFNIGKKRMEEKSIFES